MDGPVTIISWVRDKKNQLLFPQESKPSLTLQKNNDTEYLEHIVTTTTSIYLSTPTKWQDTPVSAYPNPEHTVDYRLSPILILNLKKYGAMDQKKCDKVSSWEIIRVSRS